MRKLGRQGGGGAGMGLAISRQFVQLMGGDLDVTSTLGVGSIFSFLIEFDLIENTSNSEFEQTFARTTVTPQLSKVYQSNSLTSDSLKIMSSEWIAALYQAGIEADADSILRLISQIPQEYVNLARELTNLTQNYDFDAIVELSGGNENV